MARNIVFAKVLNAGPKWAVPISEYAAKSLVNTSSAAIPGDQRTVHAVVY